MEEKSNVVSDKHPGEIRVLTEAWSVCRHVKGRLEKKLADAERNHNSYGSVAKVDGHDACHPYESDRKAVQGVVTPLVVSDIGPKVLEMQIKESRISPHKALHPSPVQPSSTHHELTSLTGKGHYSQADLTRSDLPIASDRTPRTRMLGRSYSEGSCVRSTSFLVNKCKDISTDNHKCATCPPNLCSDFLNMQPDWAQMCTGDKAVNTDPVDDQDSQLSRQESFSSSVSSPRQGWMEDGERSEIHQNVSDSFTGELKSSGRLQETSEPENSSNVM